MELIDTNSLTVTSFQWKDRTDTFHYPKDMSTYHLFHTLKMIWNHSVPEVMKVHPYKRYNFGIFYTSKYMATAVRVIIQELSNRNDLTDKMIKTLQYMQDCVDQIILTEY
jgi:hypothetical protein